MQVFHLLQDFYHRQLHTNKVPRILGMTASLINTKVKGEIAFALILFTVTYYLSFLFSGLW